MVCSVVFGRSSYTNVFKMTSGSGLSSLGTAVLLSCLLVTVSGSIIVLNASSEVVQTNLTRSTTLRCSLDDTTPSLTAPVVGRRDVTQTATNVQYVTSIIVARNTGETVARVTEHEAAAALVDQANLRVSGDLSVTSGRRGYIELTWKYPTQGQAGDYKCEVNAIGDGGHFVTFSNSLKINVTKPADDDVINQLDFTIIMVQRLANEVAEMKSSLTNFSALQHVEAGTLECQYDHSDYYSNNYNLTQLFQNPYEKPPVVTLGVTGAEFGTIYRNAQFDVSLVNVDELSFTVQCGKDIGYNSYNMSVTWMSV
ncbi:uncharacterized protein LOC101855237 [Aplysia californica]|uniref:Uncharacterized protein LOC101855237 n=1 Tax=Aplysia californica TaxID=6500 RepID=A0ABM0JG23_APLCA|nr:uncharacterized protein LOC101855237 [Aplysia californica]